MRNANGYDVLSAKRGAPVHNVVYIVAHPWFGPLKCHIVNVVTTGFNHLQYLVETMEGAQFYTEPEWLQAIPCKAGSPAKLKKKHVKGTKPWLSEFVPYDPSLLYEGVEVLCRNGERFTFTWNNSAAAIVPNAYGAMFVDIPTGRYIGWGECAFGIIKIKAKMVDYDPALIKVGTKVLCRDKKVRTIDGIDASCISFVDCHNLVDTKSGIGNYISKDPFYCDIMKIIASPEQKKQKTVEQNPKYNGYAPNVWHFWQGQTEAPPVDGDVLVDVWLREETAEIIFNKLTSCARLWVWLWGDNGHNSTDIIAFKISEDKQQ